MNSIAGPKSTELKTRLAIIVGLFPPHLTLAWDTMHVNLPWTQVRMSLTVDCP